MNKNNSVRFSWLIILSTFAIALLLNLISYPGWMQYARPDWVLLVLFYWCLAVPGRIGVGSGWLAGLALDILYYSLLGHHAIGKAFVALIAVSTYPRLRLYELWQQCLVMFVVVSIDIGLTIWIYQLFTGLEIRLVYWQSALTTSLVWPVVYILLRLLRHRTGVSL